MDVRGFQQSAEFAEAFTFTDTAESVAEEVGITNDVGMIAIHFYAEALPPADLMQGGGATKPGAILKNPVFPVIFRLEDNPHEVWRVFYRYSGDEPDDLDLQPVN